MPKKSSPRIPSYRRHKATNQAVVTINGQDIYLGKWNSVLSKAGERPISFSSAETVDRCEPVRVRATSARSDLRHQSNDFSNCLLPSSVRLGLFLGALRNRELGSSFSEQLSCSHPVPQQHDAAKSRYFS